MSGEAQRYFRNIYEAVTTVATGMWITLKTAFAERKVTVQYPSYDVNTGEARDAAFPPPQKGGSWREPLLGASQHYKGPLSTQVAQRYRGLLGFHEPTCIGCLACSRACPIGVITVKAVKVAERKGKAPLTFRVNYAKCMFCGLCVEACPTQAVYFTQGFEAATFEYRDLIREFISPDLGAQRLAQAAEAQKKKAAAQEKKAEPKSAEG